MTRLNSNRLDLNWPALYLPVELGDTFCEWDQPWAPVLVTNERAAPSGLSQWEDRVRNTPEQVHTTHHPGGRAPGSVVDTKFSWFGSLAQAPMEHVTTLLPMSRALETGEKRCYWCESKSDFRSERHFRDSICCPVYRDVVSVTCSESCDAQMMAIYTYTAPNKG